MKSISFLMLFLVLIIAQAYGQATLRSEMIKKPEAPFKNLLVISLNPNFENRKIVESELTYWINKNGFKASPYLRFSEQQNIPLKDEIVRVVTEHAFDGVLINRVKEIREEDRFEYSQRRYGNYYTGGMYTYYNYLDMYHSQYTLGYTYKEKNLIIESQLFDASSAEVVMIIESSLIKQDDVDHMIEDFAKSMAKCLKKSKLLVPTEK